MSTERSLSELKAKALEAMELLTAAIDELAEIAKSVPDSDAKTAQLKEISRSIHQLENKGVPVPDTLRHLRTSLVSELGEVDQAREAAVEIGKSLAGITRRLEGSGLSGSAQRKRKRRRATAPDSTFRRPGSFAYKKPRELVFKGERYPVRNWQDVLSKVCSVVLSGRSEKAESAVLIRGGKRPLFGRTPEGMTSPKKIEGTDLFVECNWSADGIVLKCKQILSHLGHSEDELTVRTTDTIVASEGGGATC